MLSIQTGKAMNWPALMYIFVAHADSVGSVAFSPDGKRIVSGSDDNTIRVWNAETGAVVSGPFEGHTRSVNSVAFSPDGKRIVSGSWNKTIRVWNAETGAVVSGPFEGHIGSVNTVALSPDGGCIVSGSVDETIRVWNLEQPPSAGFTDASILDNGWMLGAAAELLFWVPPSYHVGLWRPGNTAVIAEHSTKLDLGQFVHGTSWQQCSR